MSRSNAPLALSVVNLTVPGDVDASFRNITRFDDDDFGFNHNRTWNAMPLALRGKLDAAAVAASFSNAHPRVQRCITALCAEGVARPLNTLSFKDFPESGLRSIASIAWDPDIEVRVKATCWYVTGSQVVIPVLQPRKSALSGEQLAVYRRLVRQAYCQGDWVDASIKIFDLSGEKSTPTVRIIDESMIDDASDAVLAHWVKTYIDAKKLADTKRAEKPKKTVVTPMDDLLGLK